MSCAGAEPKEGCVKPTRVRLAILLACLTALSGCIIVPIPNRRAEGTGVDAKVVDSETLAPIPHARVEDDGDPRRVTESDGAGHFLLPCVYQWHAGYLWGVLSYPIWPFTADVWMCGCQVRITAPGY